MELIHEGIDYNNLERGTRDQIASMLLGWDFEARSGYPHGNDPEFTDYKRAKLRNTLKYHQQMPLPKRVASRRRKAIFKA